MQGYRKVVLGRQEALPYSMVRSWHGNRKQRVSRMWIQGESGPGSRTTNAKPCACYSWREERVNVPGMGWMKEEPHHRGNPKGMLRKPRFAITWKARQLSLRLIVTTFSCILSGNHLGVHLAWVQHKYIYVSYSHFHEDLPTTKASRLLLLIGSYLLGEEAPGNRQLLVPASGYCSGILACCLQPHMNLENLLPGSKTVWKAKDGCPTIWFGPTTQHWNPKHRTTIPVGWRALSHRAHSRNTSSHQVLHTLVWEPVETLNCKLTSGSFAVNDTWSERKSSPSRNVLQTVTWQRLMPTVQRWSSSDKDTNLKQHH